MSFVTLIVSAVMQSGSGERWFFDRRLERIQLFGAQRMLAVQVDHDFHDVCSSYPLSGDGFAARTSRATEEKLV